MGRPSFSGQVNVVNLFWSYEFVSEWTDRDGNRSLRSYNRHSYPAQLLHVQFTYEAPAFIFLICISPLHFIHFCYPIWAFNLLSNILLNHLQAKQTHRILLNDRSSKFNCSSSMNIFAARLTILFLESCRHFRLGRPWNAPSSTVEMWACMDKQVKFWWSGKAFCCSRVMSWGHLRSSTNRELLLLHNKKCPHACTNSIYECIDNNTRIHFIFMISEKKAMQINSSCIDFKYMCYWQKWMLSDRCNLSIVILSVKS